MPHSIKAKLSGLRHKGYITDTEYKRLKNAIDNENVLDKIRAEIDKQYKWLLKAGYTAYNVDIAFGAIKAALRNEVSK